MTTTKESYTVEVGLALFQTGFTVDLGRLSAAATVVLVPELGLTGYPPEDLLMRPAFMQACERVLGELARALADVPGLHVVVGHPMQRAEEDDARSSSVKALV